MAESDRFITLIKLGREERFLEYKQSAPWDDLKDKIAKTAMGMANIRDGGTIIIGMAKKGNLYLPEGTDEEHVITYDVDDLQAHANRFADPYVRTELHQVKWDDKLFFAIRVHEFDELPVVCKKDCGTLIRQGAIYTRSYRMAETCEVRSQSEMREIIDLAVQKGVRRFVQIARRVGIPLEEVAMKSDIEKFKKQLEGL